MVSKLKRFLILLATIMVLVSVLATGVFAAEVDTSECYIDGDVNRDGVVDNGDAIYTLEYTMWREMFPELYPVYQDCNFNADDTLDNMDAIYLLYASMDDIFQDLYPLDGVIHCYFEPIWEWDNNGNVASVSFNCKCPVHHEPVTEGITVTEIERQPATCVADGYVTYEAVCSYEGVEYTSQKKIVLAAGGKHDIAAPTCTEAAKCKNCDYTLPATGHDMQKDESASKAATCEAAGYDIYVCANGCTASTEVELEQLPCTYAYYDTYHKAGTCTYVKRYQCLFCKKIVEGTADEDSYVRHDYQAVLKDATCSTTGTKTYTCKECNDSYVEVVAKNDSHSWNAGTTEGNIQTFTCTACNETKTSVVATEAVKAEDMVAAEELALANDTTVQLPEEVKDELKGNATVQISVEKTTAEAAGLSAAQQEQVGGSNAAVYDFSMVAVDSEGNEQRISEFTEPITISLPYTLAEDEDVDSIKVWFINDSGEVEGIDAQYSNGFVTFTTDHFSYYTVTRLTPAERCEIYGHTWKEANVPVTCISDGHNLTYCQRCGATKVDEKVPSKGHDFKKVDAQSTDATCTAEGVLVQKCDACETTITTKLPAKGHKMVETESKAASCTAAGYVKYTCENNCGTTKTEDVAQLAHDYNVFENVAATCDTKGYVTEKCDDCGDVKTVSETAALGHNYPVENAVWTWEEDFTKATLTQTCANDNCGNTVERNAVVIVDAESKENASCTADGSITYKATASINNIPYTSTRTDGIAATGHKPAAEWSSNEVYHYHICTVCEEILEEASHEWGEKTVTKEPTCVSGGTAKVTCQICGKEGTVAIPATGEHTFVNGVCSVCGYKDGSCDHVRQYKTPIDVSNLGLCGEPTIWMTSCDCGETSYLNWNLRCEFDWDNEGYEERTLADGTILNVWVVDCPNCGLLYEYGHYSVVDKDACMRQVYGYEKLSIGGNTIAEATYPMRYEKYAHPQGDEPYDTVNLADYGLCGDILEFYHCYCGERTYVDWAETDSGCNWEWNDEEESEYRICTVCGATCTDVWDETIEPGSCKAVVTTEVTFGLNGKDVYSYNYLTDWYSHVFEITNYEMDGDTCEDGIVITESCKYCGETSKYYNSYHDPFVKTDVEMGSTDCCADKIEQFSCPCGYEKYHEYHGDCDWDRVSSDGDTTVWKCCYCGATRTQTRTWDYKDENCYGRFTNTNVYRDKNGNLIATVYDTGEGEIHNMVQSIEQLGDTCRDGVKFTWHCDDCDYVDHSFIEYNHVSLEPTEWYDLTAYDSCFTDVGFYECICGEDSWIGWGTDDNGPCNWNWDEEREADVCSKCGLICSDKFERLDTIDACHYRERQTITVSRDGMDPVVLTRINVASNHQNAIYELSLMEGAADCEDGFYVKMTCQTCGEEETWSEYGHFTYPVEKEHLTAGLAEEDKLCGEVYAVKETCACGQSGYAGTHWEGGSCDWNWEYNEVLDRWVDVCSQCGTLVDITCVETPIAGETCKVYRHETWTYYNAEGEELFEYSRDSEGENHDCLFSFSLQGETCDDGYYVTETCQNCDYVWTRDRLDYGCNNERLSAEVVYTGDDVCGDLIWEHYGCACGNQNGYELRSSCSFEWVYDKLLDREIRVCTECGLQWDQFNTRTPIANSCQSIWTTEMTLTKDGEVLASRVESYSKKDHNLVTTFQLQGQTCEDGYYVTQSCKHCDYSRTYEDLHYDHDTYVTEYYNLADYGMCGGEVEVISCACGLHKEEWTNRWCGYHETGATDPDTGLPIKKCNDCNSTFVWDQIGQIDYNNCRYNGTLYIKIFGETETKLDLAIPISHESHMEIATSLTLLNPDGDCNDGWTAEYACVNCGKNGTITDYWHRGWDREILDLSDYGTCGGYIRVGGCACGEDNYVSRETACENWQWGVDSWSETDANGMTYHYQKDMCPDCGLTCIQKWYTITDAATCTATDYYQYTYTKDGTDLDKTYRQTRINDWHDNTATYALDEGSVSCEDGMIITYTCKRCGNVSTGWTNDCHGMNAVDVYDLTDYGSVCGGELIKYQCPCGGQRRYDVSEDTLCDLDMMETESWIPDAIACEHQNTTDYVHIHSNFYNVTCAVTDPACGLRMRMAEYWLKEGCEAVEYQTWQTYDGATDTWIDIDTIPTGEHHGFHDYAEIDLDETLADGRVSGTRWECPDCGSYYEYRHEYDANDNQTKYVQSAENTLNNGEDRAYSDIYVYGYEHVGVDGNTYRYETSERYERTSADGSVYWYQNEYTYDFTDGCKRTRVYTNSNGHTETYPDEYAHREDERWETIKHSTCTQYGEERYTNYCAACGVVYEERIEGMSPIGHSWYYSYDKDCYVCDICGLENANGGSGEIVMEDLTDDYDGTNYVVGYWNRGNVDFSPYVSVILDDETAYQEDIILADISFEFMTVPEDGVCAVAFNQADAYAAAEEILANVVQYSGGYALRISFVPIGGVDTLDYAITFDSVQTANSQSVAA